ncbi:helix-turn-helix transcriptional regulator [Pendulispora rubella]|uniref:Helix-turn-helix transcriptional regulator n=1 Tax=Pendulispora rubella TaxID=2741070 RepID=A0ABZ2L4Q3_9BACT
MAGARTKTPRPGVPVRGSRTGRPIMALLDLLGRRWTLRVLWELREAPATFRALRERCDDVSPTVLNVRLKELRESGIIELSDDEGYRLTEAGIGLRTALVPLTEWATHAWSRGAAKKSTR